MQRPFSELAQLAKKVTWDVIGVDMPLGTWLQRTQSSEGEEAVRIVVVFPDSRAGEVGGEQFIEIVRRLKDALSDLGEDRIPLISFAKMEDEPELERARLSASA